MHASGCRATTHVLALIAVAAQIQRQSKVVSEASRISFRTNCGGDRTYKQPKTLSENRRHFYVNCQRYVERSNAFVVDDGRANAST